MTILFVINGLIFLFAIIGAVFLWDAYSRSLFFDLGTIFYFVVIIVPILMSGLNFLALVFLYPEFLWLSLLPLLLPLIVISGKWISNKLGEHVWDKFSYFSPELIQEASFHGVVILPEDVRVRILKGKKVDYIINAYTGEDFVELKFIEKHLLRLAQQEFTKHDIDIRVDKKSKPRNKGNS
jgi:hypothetical protein